MVSGMVKMDMKRKEVKGTKEEISADIPPLLITLDAQSSPPMQPWLRAL